jgi:hypothetical protein
MAGVAGLEPVTSAVTGQRSNQLSYTPAKGRGTVREAPPFVNRQLGCVVSQSEIYLSELTLAATGLAARQLRGGLYFSVFSFDPGNPELIIGVPHAFASFLGWFVVQVCFPGNNRVLARPVGDSDAEPIGVADAFHSQEARLLRGKFHHAFGHLSVAAVSFGALRGEDDGIIWRARRCGDSCGCGRGCWLRFHGTANWTLRSRKCEAKMLVRPFLLWALHPTARLPRGSSPL